MTTHNKSGILKPKIPYTVILYQPHGSKSLIYVSQTMQEPHVKHKGTNETPNSIIQVSNGAEPKSVSKALQISHWKEAMDKAF